MTRPEYVKEFFDDYSIFTKIAAKNGIIDKKSQIKMFAIYSILRGG